MKNTIRHFRDTIQFIATEGRLWVPFVALGLVELFFIVLVILAPQAPFSYLLARPIEFFFSGQVLRYPWHIWFVYHAMKHTHFLASVLAGAFLSGLACALVRQKFEGKELSIREILRGREVPYWRLSLLWLILWVVGRLGVKFLVPKGMMWGGVALAFFLQYLFVYTIPAVVFNRVSWWKGLWQGMRETCRYPIQTFGVVAAAVALLTGFLILFPPGRVIRWMPGLWRPELILLLVVGRLLLWTLVEALLTITVSNLWWMHRGKKIPLSQGSRISSGLQMPFLAGVTVVAILIVPWLGWMGGGRGSPYQQDRLLWRTRQFAFSVVRKRSSTPQQYQEAIAKFQEVADQFPGTRTAGRARLQMAALYVVQRDWKKAQEAYAWIPKNLAYPDMAFQARLMIAKLYEQQRRWDEAVQAYRELSDYHEWSNPGMAARLYIGDLYRRLGRSDQAREGYRSAVYHYMKLLANPPRKELGNRVRMYMVLACQHLGQWEEALKNLEMLERDSSGLDRSLVLLRLARLYELKQQDSRKASAMYAKFLREFPKHPLVKMAQAQMERLR